MRKMKHRQAATASASQADATSSSDAAPEAAQNQTTSRSWNIRSSILWFVVAYYIIYNGPSYSGQKAPAVRPPTETKVTVPDKGELQAMAVKQKQEESREVTSEKNEQDNFPQIQQEEGEKRQTVLAGEKRNTKVKEQQEPSRQEIPEASYQEMSKAQKQEQMENPDKEQQNQQIEGVEKKQSSSPPKLTDLEVLTTPEGLRSQLAAARHRLKVRMVQLYGDYNYQTLFQPWVKVSSGEYYPGVPATAEADSDLRQTKSIGDHFLFKSPEYLSSQGAGRQILPIPDSARPGWDRMVRKFQIKLLQVMLGAMDGMEECKSKACEPPVFHAKYTWMTAGTSPAMGLGNLYEETATMVMANAIQDAMASVGIDFVAKNYAMRYHPAAPELALCSASIYGHEYDSIAYDFAYGDEDSAWKAALFVNRAALAVKHGTGQQPEQLPGVFFLLGLLVPIGVQNLKYQIDLIDEYEKSGLAVLATDMKIERLRYETLPDTEMVKSNTDWEAMPPNVRNLKCGKDIEFGGPRQYPDGKTAKRMLCVDFQFNQTICPQRDGLATWVPGWKRHALSGFTQSLMLLELLTDAIDNLARGEPSLGEASPAERRARLRLQISTLMEKEKNDYILFFSKSKTIGENVWPLKTDSREITNFTSLSFQPSMCHTTLLPSYIRYKGILTENKLDTTVTVNGETYNRGVEFKLVRRNAEGVVNVTDHANAIEKEATLITTRRGKIPQACDYKLQPTDVNMDDGYYVDNRLGPRTLTIPNDSEKKHFSEFDIHNSRGWIVFCLDEWKKQNIAAILKVKVNGRVVADYVDVFGGRNSCRALKHDGEGADPDKELSWKLSADGQYNFRMVIADGDYTSVKIRSIILL